MSWRLQRLHGDDTTVPVLARSKTDIARLWVYVRDDRPFGGPAPPRAVFHYSRDRGGEHPQRHLAWIMPVFCRPTPMVAMVSSTSPIARQGRSLEAACWAHARRKFFILADVAGNTRRVAQGKAPAVLSPICLDAVQRIDALFDIERDINRQSRRRSAKTTRQAMSAPLDGGPYASMAQRTAQASWHASNDVAQGH